MVRSMTGIGRARKLEDGFDIVVRVRSVNNRYLDVGIRLPSAFSEFEHELRRHCLKKLDRGKIDINIEITDLREDFATASGCRGRSRHRVANETQRGHGNRAFGS